MRTPAHNKQRAVSAILAADDYAAVQDFCREHKIGMAEAVRRALGLLLGREMTPLRPGHPGASKPSN